MRLPQISAPRTPLEWALAYLGRGWSVIPIRPHEKRPMTRWAEFQRRRASPEEVAAWWQRSPDANVGIVTGAVSNLAVVDVDMRTGGQASLADIESVRGPFPETLVAISGGGGLHYYFAHEDDPIHNRVNLLAGIDLRGEGGCIVAPPSVHPTGGRYAWTDAQAALHDAPAQLPGWLLEYLLRHTR